MSEVAILDKLVNELRQALAEGLKLAYWAGFQNGAIVAAILLIVAYLLFHREGK